MLSNLLQDVIKSYDEIKETYHKAKSMLESIETLSNTSKTMLDESISTHQHIKTHLDEFEKSNFDEKLARFEIAFSKLPSLKQSFDKSEEDIKALLEQIRAKNVEFESTKTKLEEISLNFNTTKDEAKTIIDGFYSQSAEVLNTINKALELYLASAEEIRRSEDTIRSHKEHIDQKVLECKTIKDEIVAMRERSQCLMNKAEEILSKIDAIVNIDKIFESIKELETKQTSDITALQNLLNELKQNINNTNTSLNNEILVIKERLQNISTSGDIDNEYLNTNFYNKQEIEVRLWKVDYEISEFVSLKPLLKELVTGGSVGGDNSGNNTSSPSIDLSSINEKITLLEQNIEQNTNKNTEQDEHLKQIMTKLDNSQSQNDFTNELNAMQILIISNTNEIFKMFNKELKG